MKNISLLTCYISALTRHDKKKMSKENQKERIKKVIGGITPKNCPGAPGGQPGRRRKRRKEGRGGRGGGAMSVDETKGRGAREEKKRRRRPYENKNIRKLKVGKNSKRSEELDWQRKTSLS